MTEKISFLEFNTFAYKQMCGFLKAIRSPATLMFNDLVGLGFDCFQDRRMCTWFEINPEGNKPGPDIFELMNSPQLALEVADFSKSVQSELLKNVRVDTTFGRFQRMVSSGAPGRKLVVLKPSENFMSATGFESIDRIFEITLQLDI